MTSSISEVYNQAAKKQPKNETSPALITQIYYIPKQINNTLNIYYQKTDIAKLIQIYYISAFGDYIKYV